MPSRTYKGAVFLADDDEVLRTSIEELLEAHGYLVLGARTGLEALGRMRGAFLPGVAVVDLVMPGMNGWQLIQAMRDDPELSQIPIIVLSSHEKVPDGVQRVVRKPCDIEELLLAVAELCR